MTDTGEPKGRWTVNAYDEVTWIGPNGWDEAIVHIEGVQGNPDIEAAYKALIALIREHEDR